MLDLIPTRGVSVPVALMGATLFVVPALAESALVGAMEASKPLVDLRYRYEIVDQTGFATDANASTLRARLGWETGAYMNTTLLVEVEHIQNIGNEDFNDTVNGNVTNPVVADPETTEINRARIMFTGLPHTTVVAGRQRINLDNQRFVGAVGFRQNEQTFDAVRLTNNSISDLTLDYVFVENVNRIFGDDHPFGDLSGETHLLNASYSGLPFGKLTGYGYFIDTEEAPALSSENYGIRFSGKHAAGAVKLLYALEYAHQTEYGKNPVNFNHDYYAIDGGVAVGRWLLKGGYEVLEGNGTTAFQTPLATLHKFQGFADVFLATPAVGIEDAMATIQYTTQPIGVIKQFKFAAWYHDFSAETSSLDLGDEVDLLVKATFSRNVFASAKYAAYDGDGFAADRDKLWFTIGFKL